MRQNQGRLSFVAAANHGTVRKLERIGNRANLWVIILAAGEGCRVRGLTFDRLGRPAPKQYSSLDGGPTLLRATIERAQRIVPLDRVVVVVAEQHHSWWPAELDDLPSANIIVQPENRGTAAGLLLPLLDVFRRSPSARVVVMPSDHYVENEDVLEASLRAAARAADRADDKVILLGLTPETPETEYGWISPAAVAGTSGTSGNEETARPIQSFVEKPPLAQATRLMQSGALWNSFMFAGAATALLTLIGETVPQLLRKFLPLIDDDEAWSRERLESIYRDLQKTDFSRDVLERSTQYLRTLTVPACGWTDLGTPVRWNRCRDQVASTQLRIA